MPPHHSCFVTELPTTSNSLLPPRPLSPAIESTGLDRLGSAAESKEKGKGKERQSSVRNVHETVEIGGGKLEELEAIRGETSESPAQLTQVHPPDRSPSSTRPSSPFLDLSPTVFDPSSSAIGRPIIDSSSDRFFISTSDSPSIISTSELPPMPSSTPRRRGRLQEPEPAHEQGSLPHDTTVASTSSHRHSTHYEGSEDESRTRNDRLAKNRRRHRSRDRASSVPANEPEDDTLRTRTSSSRTPPSSGRDSPRDSHPRFNLPPPRPSRPTTPPRPSSPQAFLLPSLAVRLTCPSCRHILRDPTTLMCGHSVCMRCSSPNFPALQILFGDEEQKKSEPIFPNVSPLRSPNASSIVSPPSPSPSNSLLSNLLQPDRSPRSLPSAPAHARSRIICPHPNCAQKEPRIVSVDLKVDFVVQSILTLLRRIDPGIDSAVASSDEWDESEVEEDADRIDIERPPPEPSPIASDESGSSIGGGEDPEENESKRVHKSQRWRSVKKVRRRNRDRQGEPLELTLEGARAPLPSTFLADLQVELECQVCTQLFHDPITSSCGHTFCQKCLTRSLDHSDKCPLCRSDFPSFTYVLSQPVNAVARDVVELAFPLQAAERKAIIEAEERSSMLDTPIFVCTLAWPNLPTYLHVFEPRYRLMLRRVMNGDRQFGMVLPSRQSGGMHEYGTMLHIHSCSMTDDGRSIVETIGTYRFRILERGTFDGYTVGRIERVEDVSPEQEAALEQQALASNPPVPFPSPTDSVPSSSALPADQPQVPIELSTQQLVDVCLDFVQMLRSGSAPWVLQRLKNTIGPMPTNPSDFSYWMAEVMPVDDHVKAALLQITSPRERLRLIVFWIEQFRSSWWFSRGCCLM